MIQRVINFNTSNNNIDLPAFHSTSGLNLSTTLIQAIIFLCYALYSQTIQVERIFATFDLFLYKLLLLLLQRVLSFKRV